MFAPNKVPDRAAALRIIDRSGKSGKSAKNRREALGTLVKTASGAENGGKLSSFYKSTRYNGRRKKQRTHEDEKAARLRRFALQSVSATILRDCKKSDGKPMFCIGCCLRALIPIRNLVECQYVHVKKSSHYAGLQVCSSVWVCPLCAAKISERRRVELERIIKKHIAAGGSVYMVTYTISHHRYDDLRDLLSKFLAARSDVKGSRLGGKVKAIFGIVGTVSVLEVTWSGVNGWHPHIHELVFCGGSEMDVEKYDAMARQAWEKAAALHGLGMNAHGFKIDRTFGAVQDYIAKFGCDPATEKPWGVESEMVKGHLKQGRTTEHYTPFALLAAIHDNGRDDLKPIFQEYALCFKGRKQLNYSPGLKKLYAEEEKTDEELMQEKEQEPVTLVGLDKDQWARVLGNDIRGELLEAVRTGSPGVVINYLADFGIEASPALLSGRIVETPSGAGVISLVTKCPILNRWRCSVELDNEYLDGSKLGIFDLTQVVVTGKGT